MHTFRNKSIAMVYFCLGTLIPIHAPCLAETPLLRSLDDAIMQVYQRQNFSEEADFIFIQENLQAAYAKPLDLNKITPTALASLGILSDSQMDNFFKHLSRTGPLYSKYELQAIPGFDWDSIALLLPFVYVEERYHIPACSLREKIKSGNYYWLVRYDPSWFSKANINPKANYLPLGNLDKWITRLAIKHHSMALHITASKQAGEAFCWDPATHRYGFNIWSIALSLTANKYFKYLIIGDFQIGQGQGLLLNAGYTREKGSDLVAVMRSPNIGIRPYKSRQRKGLRGIAITSTMGPLEWTGFYANNNLDAALKWDAHCKPYTHSIADTTQYDTLHHLEKKGTLNEQTIGCTLRLPYLNNQAAVGINVLYHYYDLPIIPKVSHYSSYLFQGQQAAASSLFYLFPWYNSLWFGEAGVGIFSTAVAKHKVGAAFITGLIISLSRYLDLATALYYYGKTFYAPYGNPFKQYATNHGNEEGMYGGISWTPQSKWKLSTHAHLFATLRPKPQLDKASHGYTVVTRSSYTWHRTTTWVLQYRFNQNPKNKSIETTRIHPMDKVVGIIQKHHFKCKIDHAFTFIWRANIEAQYIHCTFKEITYPGYALSTTQKWLHNSLQASCKIIYFHTKNYVSRLYSHIPQPLYSGMFLKPLYGHGIDSHFLICWKPVPWIRLEAKYTVTYLLEPTYLKQSVANPNSTKQSIALQCMLGL
ncbi:MAG: helix-hairpin-helix domain-containing protein [Candidatus Cardinium sp.]|nr:helix-hairpin-helix domain-containing protein [Candidatus Cardinium sp.]